MIKRDLFGLLRIYCVAGVFILPCTLALPSFIIGTRVFWAQNSFFFKLIDILSILFLLFAIVVSLFMLVKYHKNWLRLERVRMKPNSLPLYEPQPSYAPALQDGGIPPALKKTMARRDIIQIILALSVILLLFMGIYTIMGFVLHTQVTVEIVLVLALAFVGLGIFFVPIGCFIVLIEYERIEASEYGLMRQKGLLHCFIPWEESRLYAVGGKADLKPEWIELSSAKVLLRWPFTMKGNGILGGPSYTYLARETPESPYRSVTRGEYEYQLQRLYGYVRLKTNLPLRDLRL